MMNSMLSSSLYGKDFINYRRNTGIVDRQRFSNKIRKSGMGLIPIVIDSVNSEISAILAGGINSERYKRHGKEYTIHMDIMKTLELEKGIDVQS